MTDPVDHALLGLKESQAKPKPIRRLTLVHAQSRAEKVVEYLGMSGEPLRAIIHWPIAGQYLVSPRSGTILGSAEALRDWRLDAAGHAFVKQERRIARASVPKRPKRVEKIAKCR